MNNEVSRAAELIREALSAYDSRYDPERGIITMASSDLAAALLAAGWHSPDQRFAEENRRRELHRAEVERLRRLDEALPLEIQRVRIYLTELVVFWPDPEKVNRRWKCRLCRWHRPPRERGVDGIMRAALRHAIDVHRVESPPRSVDGEH